MVRLKNIDIAKYRATAVVSQGHRCALCGGPITDTDIVHLDHSHEHGGIRGALHGTCNMLLGKVERGLKRGIRDRQGFVANLAAYLNTHESNQTGLLHPTWLTKDEKKLKAKKRAKRRVKALGV